MVTKFEPISLGVFGRRVAAARTSTGRQIFYIGADGERRPADDIVVPDFVSESELVEFIADLYHEWASEKYSGVKRID